MAAIYMWFEGELQTFTTTLYPIEIVDAALLSATFYWGDMREMITEEVDVSASFIGGTLRQTLKSHTLPDEEIDVSAAFLGGTLRQTLKSHTLPDEEMDVSAAFLGGSLVFKLVTVDTPDEPLQMACTLNGAACSMTVA